MALERVWPKDVYVRQVPTLAGKLYTQVIKATGTRVSIHVAGTLPFDKDNNLVGEGSMRLQVRAVLDAIGKSLATRGRPALRRGAHQNLRYGYGRLSAQRTPGVSQFLRRQAASVDYRGRHDAG